MKLEVQSIPTCDIFHGPEVCGQQHHNDDEAGDEAESEEGAEHVRQDGAEAEQQVEDRDERVSVGSGQQKSGSTFKASTSVSCTELNIN